MFLLRFGSLMERGSAFRFMPHAANDDAFLRHVLGLIHSPVLTVDSLPLIQGSILFKDLIFFISGPLGNLLFDRRFFVFEFRGFLFLKDAHDRLEVIWYLGVVFLGVLNNLLLCFFEVKLFAFAGVP